MSQQATTGFVYGMTGPDPAPQRRTGFVRPAPNRPAAPRSGTLLCDDGDGHMMVFAPDGRWQEAQHPGPDAAERA